MKSHYDVGTLGKAAQEGKSREGTGGGTQGTAGWLLTLKRAYLTKITLDLHVFKKLN